MRNPEMSSVDWSKVDQAWKSLTPLAKEGKLIDDHAIRQALNQIGSDLNRPGHPEGRQLFAILKKKAKEETERERAAVLRDARRHEIQLTKGLPCEDEEAA